jgi:anaphase-promoting complex subunit 8
MVCIFNILLCVISALITLACRAAELLDGIDYDKVDAAEEQQDNPLSSKECRFLDSSLTERESNKYLYARALFEVRQFDNAAFILSQFSTPKLRFLRLYAKYLAGEKRKEEQSQDIMGWYRFLGI